MGKIIAILALSMAAFVLGVVGPMAMTGKLNKDSLDQLMGKKVVLPAAEEIDDSGPLLKALKRERERLEAWDAQLKNKDGLLALREQELFASLDELADIQKEVNATLDQLDTKQETGIKDVAGSLSSMKPAEAAIDLASMTPEDAAKLLPKIDERKRGKILDAMEDQQKRALILQIMQERKY